MLLVDRNETFNRTFKYLEHHSTVPRTPDTPVDLTSYTIVTAKWIVGSVTITKTNSDTGYVVVNPTAGEITVRLTTAEIATFTADRGRFQLIVKNPNAPLEDIIEIIDSRIQLQS